MSFADVNKASGQSGREIRLGTVHGDGGLFINLLIHKSLTCPGIKCPQILLKMF